MTGEKQNISMEEIQMFSSTKEIHLLQFDYFKHLTILCSGLIILIGGVLIQETFSGKKCLCLLFLATGFFALCELSSIIALPKVGNAVSEINGILLNVILKNKNGSHESQKKYDLATKAIKPFEYISILSFVAGFLLLLLFLFINIL